MVSAVKLSLIALVVVLFAFITIDAAKECHTCDSIDSCKKVTNASVPVQCADKQECIKVDNSKGEARYRRCDTQEVCDLFRYCYLCKEDKCNSSSSVSPSFVVMGIVGAIIAKYYM